MINNIIVLLSKNRAFTLIELLVVVLIIGILAAVALPQYQFAVEKSRSAEVMRTVRVLDNSIRFYHLERNNYPAKITDLNTPLPNCDDTNGQCKTGSFVYRIASGGWLLATKPDNSYRFERHFTQAYDKFFCMAQEGKNIPRKLCQHLSGANSPRNTNAGYEYYDIPPARWYSL